jgi:hypothetical protein
MEPLTGASVNSIKGIINILRPWWVSQQRWNEGCQKLAIAVY